MEPVAVECTFSADGTIRVKRVKRQGTWLPVTQGRQWLDDGGRNVLIMLDDTNVRTLRLSAQSLIWEIAADQSPGAVVV